MTRSMSREEIRSLQLQIRDARSISEVLRLARTRRIERVPGGYRITRHTHVACDTDYTAAERAWFRAPIKGAL